MMNLPFSTLAATLIGSMLLFGSTTARAASSCSGLGETTCQKQETCTWVKGYTTKTASKVKGYCRLKPGRKTDAEKAGKKSDAKAGKAQSSKKGKSKKGTKDDKPSTRQAIDDKDTDNPGLKQKKPKKHSKAKDKQGTSKKDGKTREKKAKDKKGKS